MHDVILCPPVGAFDCPLSYYETITHEVVHWTGHESRLARRGTRRPSISEYAFEELIAEMGAAFLCADLGLTATPREDHAASIAEWLEALRNDRRMIFAAATKAQQAADFLHQLQPGAMGA
jgi:antirestriction protein ArdC